MGDIVLLFLLNNVLLFGIIFWVLMWIAEYFYTKKNQVSKYQFYECGFKATSDVNIQINLNFAMLCVFLILYDIEFTLLFPYLFNIFFTSFFEFFFFIVFVFLIIISLIYDWQQNSLGWQY